MDFWYYQPLCDVLAFPQGLFFSEKMTLLENFDMYLMIFDINSQYLVRFSQYLVKIHQYLVNIVYVFMGPVGKKIQRQQSSRNWMLNKNVDTSRFWTRKPKSCNIHIYHFHVLELLNLDFSIFWGWGWGKLINKSPQVCSFLSIFVLVLDAGFLVNPRR